MEMKPDAMPELNFNVMLEEIKANQKRLDECPRHHFPTLPDLTIGVKMNCANCGGTIHALNAYAYTRGYIAAGGDGNDIIPGWS